MDVPNARSDVTASGWQRAGAGNPAASAGSGTAGERENLSSKIGRRVALQKLAVAALHAVPLIGLVLFLALTVVTLRRYGPFHYFGIDFVGYYTAGWMIAHGQAPALYDGW